MDTYPISPPDTVDGAPTAVSVELGSVPSYRIVRSTRREVRADDLVLRVGLSSGSRG